MAEEGRMEVRQENTTDVVHQEESVPVDLVNDEIVSQISSNESEGSYLTKALDLVNIEKIGDESSSGSEWIDSMKINENFVNNDEIRTEISSYGSERPDFTEAINNEEKAVEISSSDGSYGQDLFSHEEIDSQISSGTSGSPGPGLDSSEEKNNVTLKAEDMEEVHEVAVEEPGLVDDGSQGFAKAQWRRTGKCHLCPNSKEYTSIYGYFKHQREAH